MTYDTSYFTKVHLLLAAYAKRYGVTLKLLNEMSTITYYPVLEAGGPSHSDVFALAIDTVALQNTKEPLLSLFSNEAMDSLQAMVDNCLRARVGLGMDEGYDANGDEHPFVKEIREAFGIGEES